MAPHDLLGQPQLAPDLAHFVLEQLPQRLDQLPGQVRSQSADVVMRLDRGRWPARSRRRFDDVGIQGALDQEADIACDVAPSVLEYVDECMADAAALLLRVLHVLQLLEEES